MYADLIPEEPSDIESRDIEFRDLAPNEDPNELEPDPDEVEEPSDLDFTDMTCTDDAGRGSDESQWDAFLPDDDWDPEPDPSDFWIEGVLDDTPTGALVFPLDVSPSHRLLV